MQSESARAGPRLFGIETLSWGQKRLKLNEIVASQDRGALIIDVVKRIWRRLLSKNINSDSDYSV